MNAKTPFLSLSREQARQCLAERGASPLHADRIRRALLAGRSAAEAQGPKGVFPKGLLPSLEADFEWLSLSSVLQRSAPDGAEKHLLKLADGETVEAVRLPGSGAPSACLSTQVGCGMACAFCASGLEGVRRNLHRHELLEQVALLRRSGPVRRLVFMGAGEPTQNLHALSECLQVLKAEGEIGPRSVLVSTVGPPAAIERLAALPLRPTLAISLHTLDPQLRARLIPTQAQVDPHELLRAADRYAEATGRPYQVEYVLLGGLNDSAQDAHDLAEAMQGRRGHLSLIAWNPVAGMAFERPAAARVEAFLRSLYDAGVSANLRRTVGGEAEAACGQLRASARGDARPRGNASARGVAGSLRRASPQRQSGE